jgi:MoaA/NifB/PqqE/SkfB family radical SAM enzyme
VKSPRNQRLESLRDHRVRLGPQTVHIDLTNACDADCVTCWDHSPHLDAARPIEWKRQRADAAWVKALISDVESLGGLEAVIVSGMGEPFTHPDIDAILADLKRRGLHVTVITNARALDPARVVELGVDQLLLGIHAASEESYLKFHPSWDARRWAALHDKLEVFKAAGRRFKHVQVICQHNAHELPAMIELAHRYGAERVNFKLASLKDGTEAVRVDDLQRERLLQRGVPEARELAELLEVRHNLDVFDQQLRAGGSATAAIEEVGCFLGFHYSRITVDRTVLYCCNTDVVVGQLDDRAAFSELWRGRAWADLRARMREGRYFDSCRQCGKLNQNVKLSERFRARFGDDEWRAARGEPSFPALRVLP